ncbi:MAG: C4-dicarboxylate ABC transporter [Deltaproteobacteria bacterium SM23_61]|nr:MAG: C4-dicarboxylate ABC transporter [Deltaproteobacteria bacterium SM23_61]
MSPAILGIFILVVSLVFLLSGMPIAFALGAVSLFFIVTLMDVNQLFMTAHTVYEGLNDFGLLAIPLFILMGSTIAHTKAGADLYEALHRWLYRLPGGLGISNIFSCAVFAALCGSSPATAAAIGTAGIPEMRKRGYPGSLATGVIVAGGTLGILIPPSVTMIVYGIATQSSVGKLFIAGVIPGLLMTGLFSVWVIFFMVLWRRNPGKGQIDSPNPSPATESYTLKEKLASLPRVLPFILLIVIMMWALYGGLATPSEAAAVGAIAALIMVKAFYQLTLREDLLRILKGSIRESTMILMIVGTSYLFGVVLTKLYITQTVANGIIELALNKWLVMLIINFFLLVLGCFMPPVAIILITAPILHPIITGLGFDTIWFGVIITLNMEAGLITPPVGLNLYIVQGIAPDVPISQVLQGSMPFLLLLGLGIIILCIWPELALWLPNKMITR